MELVIKIPDGIYYFLMEHPDRQFPYATEWVRQGTPLPKGHGALKDADEVMNLMERNFDMQDLYLPIHFKQFALDEAKTIIPADKEVDE